MTRVAFYAPLKAPSHDTPSGDRRMAELLMRALELAGCEVGLASRFRSYDGAGEGARQRLLKAEGEAEAARLTAAFAAGPGKKRPEAWFTYHLYHKAPDWLGPSVSRSLAIPYLVAEAAHAPKQAGGPWALGHDAAGRAIAQADAVLCMTGDDRLCLEPLLGSGARLHELPPFLDPEPFSKAAAGRPRARAALAAATGLDAEKRWLLTVAMMRAGDKLASYRALGAALGQLEGEDWQLLVVGEGPARDEVAAALAPLGPDRVVLAGARPWRALAEIYAACDLYLWPALGEAYGMALLEAQASGLPVVAGKVRGVPDVVRDGVTGMLTPEGDGARFAAAVRCLLDDDRRRARMGRHARDFVTEQRSLAGAARILERVLAAARAARRGAAA